MESGMSTPQEKGREWEEIWSAKVQGQKTPGSGNQWYSKLDVRSKLITWSNKWTGKDSFRVDRGIIDENRNATLAPGGNGTIPALAIRIENVGDFVVIGADDFLELLKAKPIIQAEKADNRRATAAVPQLLREVDGN